MSRVILVSNRLPVSIQEQNGTSVVVRSSGGLVSGLAPVHDRDGGLWVGTLGGSEDVDPKLFADQRLVVVTPPEEQARRHYEGYSNQVIWPLCHYLIDHVYFEGQDFDAYRSVNRRFADAVAAHAQPDDIIWVHDYHLMLLPSMLRERLPQATIGFFLHIPFPSSEVFRILPRKEEILQGLLGANLIGLHTYDYARHLVSTFRRVLGVEFDEDWVSARDGKTKIGVYPLGVDAPYFEGQDAPEIEENQTKIQQIAKGRKIILGVDRMDYTKGLALRLQAFERLLHDVPRWRQDVVFFQVAVPSRSTITTYRELKEEIDRHVGAINGLYEREGLVPVHYLYRSIPVAELIAFYRAADVAWVTPVRDGMNLVAKEYVASRQDNTGVLVLSEFAGAASEMGEALLHNPWDIDGSSRVLERALTLDSEEMGQRMAGLRKRVRINTVHHWAERFLHGLEGQKIRADSWHMEHGASAPGNSRRWIADLLTAFSESDHALVALDYDGTLVDLQPDPLAASPDPALLDLLETLSGLEGLDVVIISGRDPSILERWVGHLPITLVAEHGLHWRLRGSETWDVLLEDADTSWKDSVHRVLEDFATRAPGSFIEEKPASLAWHYRRVEPAFGNWQARELAQHLSEAFANSPLEVLHGSKVVEVRPQGFDKGRALTLLRTRLGTLDFEIVVGDDRTDEDMFQSLEPGAWSIKVGSGRTYARHSVGSPRALRRLLQEMCSARS